MLSGFVLTGAGGANQFGRPGFDNVGEFAQVFGNIAKIHKEFVERFGVDVDGLVEVDR